MGASQQGSPDLLRALEEIAGQGAEFTLWTKPAEGGTFSVIECGGQIRYVLGNFDHSTRVYTPESPDWDEVVEQVNAPE